MTVGDLMKFGAFGIALFGALFGLLSAYEQNVGFDSHLHFGSTWLTVVCSLVGALGGCLLLTRWKYAPWILLLAAVGGVYPNMILWEGAGSFFLVSGFMGFATHRVEK